MSVNEDLYWAVGGGHVKKVISLLQVNPDFDINWENENDFQWTCLHIAASNGQAEVMKLLLEHPHINVNLKDVEGQTPLLLACCNGHVSVVQLLLKDPRVDITLEDHNGRTPLWVASRNAQQKVIEWLIASGRDLGDVKNKRGKHWVEEQGYNALETAREIPAPGVVLLLERFMANPALTRHELRVELEFPDELAADLFAVIVFLCDGLLQSKPALAATFSNPGATGALRFFAIASKLPRELQMVLCRRAVGSMKQNILHWDSEAAFKSLAKILALPL